MMKNLQSSAFVAKTTQLLSSVARLRLLLVMLLTLTASTAWAETETLAKWTFTSSSYPKDKTNFEATSGTCKTGSTFYLNGSGSAWNTSKGYAFNAVTDITITVKLSKAISAGTPLTFSADMFYNKVSNAPMTGFDLSVSENGSAYSTTGLSVTSISLSTSSANKAVKYTTQNALAKDETIKLKYTGTGKAGSGQGYFNNIQVVAEIADAPSFSVSATSNNNSYGTVSVSGTTITATPATGYTYANPAYTVTSGTATVSQNGNTFTVTPESDCTVQINFEEKEKNIYIDNVQGNSIQTLYDTHAAPSLTDETAATTGTCEELHWHFMGWVTEANKENPTDANIVKANTSVTANGTTYYAVWAIGTTTGGGSTSKQYSFDITKGDFNTTSYAANNNSKTSTAKASDNSTKSVSWTSNQVMQQSSTMQWQSSKGYIYNTTDLGNITNITITSTAGTFTTYYGTSQQPSQETSVGTGNGYFQIKVGSATGKVSNIKVTFTQTEGGESTTTYSDYTTSCSTETLPSMTASVSSLAFGNVTVNQSSQKTFTLSGSNLTADATLALSGTNAGLFSVTPSPVTPTDGSITNETITVTYTPDAKASHSATLTISSEGADDVTVSLSGTGVAQTADYTVNHYQQNITDDNYTLKETEKLSGEVGTSVTPDVKSYEGFTAPTTATTVTIKADGTTVVKYYYTRDSYTLTWNLDGGTITTEGTPEGAVKYGASLTAPVVVKDGFNFKGWNPSVPTTMPADNATYTAQWKATYTVTFLNHGEEVEKVTVEADNPVTLPTEELTSCDTENYPDFFGWTETPIAGVGTEEPADLITADFTPERSMTLHAVFVDQLPQAGGWQVVTSASELVAGKIYTIGSYGSPDSGVAMGEQKSNNRGTTSWTTGTPVELTLGGSTGAWTLYDPVEEGYLYAASNSDNYLKTQTTLNNNGRWAITISSNKAKIQAQGDKTRNIIRYNSSSSIFSCYASGQGDIQLLTKAIGTQPTAFITSCCETPAPTNGNAEVLSGTSVKLTWKGTASRYHITGGNLADEGVNTPATSYTVSGLTECETYTFNISAAPENACESAAISVTATPFEAKTITFEDGSTKTTLSTTCENDEIVVPTPTERNCSTYVWIDEQGNKYAAGDKITPTTNMTLTTVWTVIPYTVTFVDYDGTTVLKESDVNCGEMPTPPTDPTRPENNTHKYTFAGWTPTIVPANSDATYTATYTETQHQITVIWMVNGEVYTEGEPSTVVLAGGQVAKLPTPPSPDDYCGQVFAGWTDQPIDGDPIAYAPAVLFNTPETSPTLYKEGDKTTVTFYAVFADIKE